jgi:hypothetical protein
VRNVRTKYSSVSVAIFHIKVSLSLHVGVVMQYYLFRLNQINQTVNWYLQG